MVVIKKNLYYRSVSYVFLMIICFILTYLFLYNGFNTRTRIKVEYEDSSDIYYKVNYIDSSYNSTYNDKYISDMVNYIDMSYIYNNLISEYVSGYYKYNVEGYLIAYEDDITNSLWERKYELVKENTVVINKNNVNNIKIEDSFKIDFNKYKDEIQEFIDVYDINVSGYLHIRINIMEFLDFNNLNNEYADSKVITVNVPITDDVFKINVNNLKDRNSYYEFSNKESMNIYFLLIGAFCFSLTVTCFIMVIKQFNIIYKMQSRYRRELNKILSKYNDCIVKVKRFYVNKKYNMIYVDSFSELMDVYNNKNKMISFKEIKRDCEAIFVIIDGDDAWIYKLLSKNID